MNPSPPFWTSRRLLVTVEGPQGRSAVPLARPFARIGRQSGSDIVLDSPWVSKRSVYLHATDAGVFCIYMQPEETSSQRMGYWLGADEPLLVGPYRISAVLEGDAPGPAPAFTPLDEWGCAAPPYPVFQVYSAGKLRDKRKFLAQLNLIGRRHECALQIKGQHVSAFHGCLYWHQARLWYIDLASSNGSSVNGTAVDVAELHVGDRLETGEFTLLFQRLSQRGGRSHSVAKTPATERPPDQLPADFDDDLPPDIDDDAPLEPADSTAGTSAVIPLAVDETIAADQFPIGQAGSAAADAPAPAAPTGLATVNETRHELAALQKRVEELTQVASHAGEQAARQLSQQTREALARERQRIAQELKQRAEEIAREKESLQAQWQSASRELATQVSQLRDEAQQLAAQRQAMEQSRLLWDQQRAVLEAQLRSYAEQLGRLEQGTVYGLPAPPAGGLPAPFATTPLESHEPVRHKENGGMVPLVGGDAGGSLVPRSHVVDAQVAPTAGDPHSLPRLLEGSLSAETAPETIHPAGSNGSAPRLQRELAPAPVIKGRKTAAKGTQAFDSVTDRIVDRDQGQRQRMLIVGIVVAIAAIVLSAAIVISAVIWGLNR